MLVTRTATIANGASLSDAVELSGSAVIGIVTPAAWTAADLTLQASHDGSTYNNVYDKDEAEMTIQAGASRYIALEPNLMIGAEKLKLRSGTSGTPVNQGAERVITLILYVP